MNGADAAVLTLLRHAAQLRDGLILAAYGGHERTVKHILTHRADAVQTASSAGDGVSALHAAAMAGHSRIAMALIQHGASIESRNRLGRTPLQLAIEAGHDEATTRAFMSLLQPSKPIHRDQQTANGQEGDQYANYAYAEVSAEARSLFFDPKRACTKGAEVTSIAVRDPRPKRRSSSSSSSSSARNGFVTLRCINDGPPNVYAVDDFVGEEELRVLLTEISSKARQAEFRPSHTDATSADTSKSAVSAERTSESLFLGQAVRKRRRVSSTGSSSREVDGDDIARLVATLEERAAALVGMGSKGNSTVVEPMQVVRYGPHAFFGLHHDAGTLYQGGVQSPPTTTSRTAGGAGVTGGAHIRVSSAAARRLFTVFVYLKSPAGGGGETVFPRLGLSVAPHHAGRALLFSNVLPDGRPDPLMVHLARPVKTTEEKLTTTTEGLSPSDKYGANLWVTDFEDRGHNRVQD